MSKQYIIVNKINVKGHSLTPKALMKGNRK